MPDIVLIDRRAEEELTTLSTTSTRRTRFDMRPTVRAAAQMTRAGPFVVRVPRAENTGCCWRNSDSAGIRCLFPTARQDGAF